MVIVNSIYRLIDKERNFSMYVSATSGREARRLASKFAKKKDDAFYGRWTNNKFTKLRRFDVVGVKSRVLS